MMATTKGDNKEKRFYAFSGVYHYGVGRHKTASGAGARVL